MKIPKNQTIVMTYYKNNTLAYVITENNTKDTYTLFSVDKDENLKKLKTANTPTKFDEVYSNNKKG